MFPLLTNPIGELKVSIEIEPDDVQDQIVHKLDLGNFQDFEAKVQKLILDGVKAGYPLSPLLLLSPSLLPSSCTPTSCYIFSAARYDRLKKSICNQIRADLKDKAQQHALNVFGHNLERYNTRRNEINITRKLSSSINIYLS